MTRTPLEKALAEFVGAFDVVFHHDWEYTSSMIGDEAAGATFLEPGLADETEDWGARGALLEKYRTLVAEMRAQGLKAVHPFPLTFLPGGARPFTPAPPAPAAGRMHQGVSGALRTFAYFMSSGTHYMLEGVDYLSLYGNEPSAIEQAYAIFANVLEFDGSGRVLNAAHAQRRATDYIREYCDPSFRVDPPFEAWETELH
jgi:hypothetical protein